MLKKTLLLCFSVTIVLSAKAQMTDSLFNKLGDFDLARFNKDAAKAIRIGESILPDTAKINPKTRISFFGRLAKLYEDDEQDAKAITYYRKVIVVVPDYYVAQRALGYLYDKEAEEIHLKLYNTKTGEPAYKPLFDGYKIAVLKALRHLEKAQACDPDDDTLDLIKTLYQNIKDDQGLNSLNDRLNKMKNTCIDILPEN